MKSPAFWALIGVALLMVTTLNQQARVGELKAAYDQRLHSLETQVGMLSQFSNPPLQTAWDVESAQREYAAKWAGRAAPVPLDQLVRERDAKVAEIDAGLAKARQQIDGLEREVRAGFGSK